MSRDDELKLLGTKTCPFAIRVRIALNQKGLSYDFLAEDVKNKSELFLRSNPVHKKILVFIHNGRSICESLVILQYIHENWSETSVPSLLPADPYQSVVLGSQLV
ncbi:Glutathione S-transferase family protein [Rhynchospora pubera]|uniref:Glutathione S-transferase n=1 Tax=Rhynchospora pubera TaxID=906938 RepID=A0AAV8G399_9POAL|nr:Glutathione S-transferase family protein [Rhynchospora pubera]